MQAVDTLLAMRWWFVANYVLPARRQLAKSAANGGARQERRKGKSSKKS